METSFNIIDSFKILKGNTKTAVLFEPLWGIPYVLYTFYLSLYMKGQGVTDPQLGWLISIGFISGSILSLFAGMITDALGRKKTTLIFDLISWPVALLIYLVAHNFWVFALATVVNSFVRIVSVSWNLMVIEDADSHQQVAAFNWMNIINVSTGVLTPIAGFLVHYLGIVKGEKILLGYAIVSMLIMILARNHYFKETGVGQEILQEHQGKKKSASTRKFADFELYRSTFKVLRSKPKAFFTFIVVVLFNIYVPIGAFTSLYFAPFLNEVIKLDKSAISILGFIIGAILMVIFVFIMPVLTLKNRLVNMAIGFLIQAIALGILVIIPQGIFGLSICSVIVYAIGYGISKPFIDTALAEVSEGKERTGIYALTNTVTTISCIFAGFLSGYLYSLRPALIYFLSILILILCSSILWWMNFHRNILLVITNKELL